MKNKKEILIFDFDGVIGDTFEFNYEIIKELHPEVQESRYRIDHHMGNVYENPSVSFTKETKESFFKQYSERLTADHIKNFLPHVEKLYSKYAMHIVSSNSESAISRVLEDAGIRDYFGHVLGKETHESKVEKFKHLAQMEGIRLREALFITDTLGDLNEANKVSLVSYAVSFGYHPDYILKKGHPKEIFSSWEEAIQFLL
ncbi:MAG: HAD-IA family hydrolase [Candidatus Nomurabacteria bacterium]|nr:HAD-IA family hydrolase [Candidatus Nomurabacteria bacterium]USN87753.1 MAG: HAD-IA family hydrolase [Candidatus Nomurabacteria bacterium]